MTDTKDPTTTSNEPAAELVTLTIPARLAPLIHAAASAVDVIHGVQPERHELLLALIERGARALARRADDPDARPVTDLTVAELADSLGLLDLEGARRHARVERQARAEAADAAVAILADVKGLRAACIPRNRITTPEELDEAIANVRHNVAEHAAHVVLIVGYVVPNGAEIKADPPQVIN